MVVFNTIRSNCIICVYITLHNIITTYEIIHTHTSNIKCVYNIMIIIYIYTYMYTYRLLVQVNAMVPNCV